MQAAAPSLVGGSPGGYLNTPRDISCYLWSAQLVGGPLEWVSHGRLVLICWLSLHAKDLHKS